MSEVRWTPHQHAAIEDTGGTLLVSAAAGSGKTAVLVERAVRLMTDAQHPIDADRLLIVTFTRAAAEEMRARIADRLAKEASAQPQSAFLRRQRLLLGRANICTIDAFCMQLLKHYFAELNLPPDFGLADDAKIYEMRETVLAGVLEELYADEDFQSFAALYGRARSDDGAARAVLSLYDYARTLPYPEKALQAVAASYEGEEPLGGTPWGRRLLQEASDAVASAQRLLYTALGIVEGEPRLANYKIALEDDSVFLIQLRRALDAQDWDEAALCAWNYAPGALKAVRGFEGPEQKMVKALRDEMKDIIQKRLAKSIFVCTNAEFDEDRRRIAPMARALVRGAQMFSERFYADKLTEKLLEYSDFEHLALKLLCGEDCCKTAVARTVSNSFDAVMVDEYQDTNELQALLYQCLANDDASNLFLVGDVKQSIYRFRLASPDIFVGKRDSFSAYHPGGAHPAVITLGENFRSAQNVIDQVNDVFSCVMRREAGGVDYNDEEKLVFGGASDGYDGGPMELHFLELGTEEKGSHDAAAAADAVERVKNTLSVRVKGGGMRPCEWGDICILLRGRKNFPLYEAELTRRGIPVFADTSESPLEAPEVSPLLSMLRILDNPRQDIHLTAVLLSAMFSFTPDDLTALRLLRPKGNMYAALIASEEEKARAFCDVLRTLRRLASSLSVTELCDEIFARTHYFAAVGAMENGPARRETLRAFLAWAGAVDSGIGGLSAFLRTVDNALERKTANSAGTPALPQSAVSIMTIHRSKGLEFPVVILADASHGFNMRDTSGPVLFHPQLGMGMKLRAETGGLFQTAPHRALALAMDAESVSEEMRILYVALTRARDKLIVTVPLKGKMEKLSGLAMRLAACGVDTYTLRQARAFDTWLTIAALLHPDGGELRRAVDAPSLPLSPARGHLRIGIHTVGESQQDTPEPPPFRRTVQPDEALLARLRENFAQDYPNAPLCALPAKVSVSELTHGALPTELARPAFLYKTGMTAAERGTAMHAALQFLDLDNACRDAPAEIERLARGGWISGEAAKQIELPHLKLFLQSPLAQRMRAAETLLREYAFLTAVPAVQIDSSLSEPFAYAPVQVQGIADVVIVNGDTAEIADYKTDRGKTPEELRERYEKQLLLYRAAVEKRLRVSVTRCTIYSFALAREIDIPLPARP